MVRAGRAPQQYEAPIFILNTLQQRFPSGPSHYIPLDGDANEGEDKPMPGFEVFLHCKASLNPILEQILSQ